MDGLKAKIDYPLLKKNLLVELSQEDEEQIERIMCDINTMKEQSKRQIPRLFLKPFLVHT